MTPAPITTPYDILPPGLIAWEPGPAIWFALVATLLLAAGIVRMVFRPKPPRLKASAELEALLRERLTKSLRRYEQDHDGFHLTTMSLDVRSFLAVALVGDARSLTASELKKIATGGSAPPGAGALLSALADLDEFEYQPEPSVTEGVDLGKRLIEAAERYFAERISTIQEARG
jgi:hypothetical protein